MPSTSSRNRAIIAAAGSGKTETILESALAPNAGRVLIATFTRENQLQIIERIEGRLGFVPPNVTVMGWVSFLLDECARPYQSVLGCEPNMIRGYNLLGERNRFAKRTAGLSYFMDRDHDFFRDGLADFVCSVNAASGGKVIRRLEAIFDHILVDEVQDLVGYDLEVLDLLMKSSIALTFVGDPRQHTYSTNRSPKNKQYRGTGFLTWIEKRRRDCELDVLVESYRCNQGICDFADSLFPDLPKTVSRNCATTGHDGIFLIPREEVYEYCARYKPVVLRESRVHDTMGLRAMNIGVSKGRTFDRVLIFGSKPALEYVKHRNLDRVKSPVRLYVAVTRARYSATLVVP